MERGTERVFPPRAAAGYAGNVRMLAVVVIALLTLLVVIDGDAQS